jgi:hypothetical protein
MDEIIAFMAMLPFIGIFFRRIHTWLHGKLNHKCHEKTCDDTHVEHIVPAPFTLNINKRIEIEETYLIDELNNCSPEVRAACIALVENSKIK